MTRILTDEEKAILYSMARGFIFPSSSSTAIEPPLTVLESVAHGTPIITTGTNSTKEIAYATNGFVYSDLSQLQRILETVLPSKKNNNPLIARRFAMEHLSFSTFKAKILNIINM